MNGISKTAARVLSGVAVAACIAAAAVHAQTTARAPDPPPTTILQARPVFPDLLSKGLTPQVPASDIIDVVTVGSLRDGFDATLADWGLLTPRLEIALSINAQYAAQVERVLWRLEEEFYFPEKQFDDREIRVIAWRDFPVTAEARFKDGSVKTYSTWVEVN